MHAAQRNVCRGGASSLVAVASILPTDTHARLSQSVLDVLRGGIVGFEAGHSAVYTTLPRAALLVGRVTYTRFPHDTTS